MEATVTLKGSDKKVTLIKNFIKELSVKFKEEGPYSDEFVARMNQSIKDFEQGRSIKMSMEKLHSLCK